MVEPEPLRCFVKFSESGELEDLQLLFPILLSGGRTTDVNLLLALDVSRKCVEILELEWVFLAWCCLSYFLVEENFAHAEAFAECFLRSSVGHRAFQCTKRCLAACGDPCTAHRVYGHALQFLASATRYEPLVVHVLKEQPDTYRVLFTYIVQFCSELSSQMHSTLGDALLLYSVG
jgi:hypothetical protein